METHAHELHKAPGHGWTHYLFEFFMLFLAVFCGFLAENFREHREERHREREYVKSLAADLRADTADIHSFLRNSLITTRRIDTMIRLLQSPDRDTLSQILYFDARTITSLTPRFLLHDRTYEQMKSSGSLRLIMQEALARSVSVYYAAQTSFKEQAEIQINRQLEYANAVTDVFDATVFQQMLKAHPMHIVMPEGHPKLITNDPSKFNAYIGKLHYFGAVLLVNSSSAAEQEEATIQLLKQIEQYYHFK